MDHSDKIIVICGGTGFVGRYVVKILAKQGYRLRIISRYPEAALHLKTAGDPGQIQLISGNITQPESIAPAFKGAYGVVNLVGILFESGHQHFGAIQAEAAGNIANLATKSKVKRLVHLSALGVDKTSGSEYARTKFMGEKAVITGFPNATILRPSVIFGAEDQFFNQFAAMPFHPLIGGGNTKFQPVYVGDVAACIATALEQESACGNIYEIGGEQIYSFRELLEYVQKTTGAKKCYIPLPFGMASMVGCAAEIAFKINPFMQHIPITRDQVKLLRYDNVVNADTKTIRDLGVTPTPLDAIVPGYLARYNYRAAA